MRLAVSNIARVEVLIAVCWRFSSPGIWRCIPTFRKGCRLRSSRSTTWPQRWKHYDSSNLREVLIQRQHHIPEEMNLQTVTVLHYVFAGCFELFYMIFVNCPPCEKVLLMKMFLAPTHSVFYMFLCTVRQVQHFGWCNIGYCFGTRLWVPSDCKVVFPRSASPL